ncbi:MAG TPA: hypothetical protein VGJ50_23935 [Streptosporangiaceae bacterium]|jgi:hypothetical protein
MDAEAANRLSQKMVEFLETGTAPEGLFQADVFLDLSLPTWRIQTKGDQDLEQVRKGGHPWPGTVTRWRSDPTPTGLVFEFEERWSHEGQQWYAREMMRMDVVDGSIAELTVYCTGDWDEARQREHASTVSLIRP